MVTYNGAGETVAVAGVGIGVAALLIGLAILPGVIVYKIGKSKGEVSCGSRRKSK